MAQTTMSIRVDEDLKTEFEQAMSEMGMNATTGVNMFIRAVIREGRIPFEIRRNDQRSDRERILKAVENVRAGKVVKADMEDLQRMIDVVGGDDGGRMDGQQDPNGMG